MTLDSIKAWIAPMLFSGMLVMAGYIFLSQQDRINALETDSLNARTALATISENQKNNTADRNDFQQATSAKIDKMADTLNNVGQSLAALTALQKQSMGK